MDIKAITIKFNPKDLKFDYNKAKAYKDAILKAQKSNILDVNLHDDYNPTIGYHFNGYLKSTNYKQWLRLYKNKGPTKDKKVFIFMKSIPPNEVPYWDTYILKRQCEFNVKQMSF